MTEAAGLFPRLHRRGAGSERSSAIDCAMKSPTYLAVSILSLAAAPVFSQDRGAVREAKLRSALTVLGMIFGVVALLSLWRA